MSILNILFAALTVSQPCRFSLLTWPDPSFTLVCQEFYNKIRVALQHNFHEILHLLQALQPHCAANFYYICTVLSDVFNALHLAGE